MSDEKKKKKKSSGYHSFKVKGVKFKVDTHYVPQKPIGEGAYGIVCSAIDKKSNDDMVAIKMIPKAFRDPIEAKRILREIKLMRHFDHENIVGLRDLIPPPPGAPLEEIYMVMDYMETDLHQIIYGKSKLSDEHMQYFIYQVLRGLKFIHSANVMHRDLKPSNLLLNSNCDLKICDFGLARGFTEEKDSELTEYVVTRWYRAPEVMLAVKEYDHQIDVWSVGCIMAELFGSKPLVPGNNYIHQMNLIFDVLGTPSEDDLEFVTNVKALAYIKNKLLPRKKMDFHKQFPKQSDKAIDLLEKMLVFNPKKRITVAKALEHPWFADLHKPQHVVECKTTFETLFENEGKLKHKEDLQRAMWQEILPFRPDCIKRKVPISPPDDKHKK